MDHYPPSSQQAAAKWQQMMTVLDQWPAQPDPSKAFRRLKRIRFITENCLVFLLQYGGLMISLFHSPLSPIWLASGTAGAFVFLRGMTVIPGIWLGSAVAYYLNSHNTLITLSSASLYAMQAFLLLRICQRYISPSIIFYRKREAGAFVLLALLLSMSISFLLAVTSLPMLSPNTTLFGLWLQWWLANFNGMLIFIPALLTWDAYFPQIALIKIPNRMMYSVFGLLIALLLFLLLNPSPTLLQSILVILPLFILIIGLYFGRCVVMMSVFMIGISCVFGGYFGVPLFHASISPVVFTKVQLMLSCVAILAVTSLSRHPA